MKTKKLLMVLGGVALMCLTSCDPNAPTNSGNGGGGGGTGTASSTATPVAETDDMSKKYSMNMSVQYQDSLTKMSFGALPESRKEYNAADGKKYTTGLLKPVWAEVQNKMNITIVDQSPTSDTSISSAFETQSTNNFAGIDIAQGSSSAIVNKGTTSPGSIVDLSDYLDVMPNFSKFLEDNPIVATSITDYSGSMFYAPYFDGYDDIERMLMLRQDWVETLLDRDTGVTYDTDKTIIPTTSYTPFMPNELDATIPVVNAEGTAVASITKTYTAGQGVINRQNAIGANNMDGASLVRELKGYIDSTYGNQYTKRSDLFCGQNAAYDIDELVALYRCVRANPALLTGNGENKLVPLFPRQKGNERTADLWRFTQMFGVRGGESRNGYLYVNDAGQIVDARNQEDMRDALLKLNQMYNEGLILQNFDQNIGSSKDFRKTLLTGNLGFSTYDYNQTTTAFNDDSNCVQIEGFLFTSVLPAVADWRHDGNYFHFTESWRSVKSEGWFITGECAKNPEKLRRALTIFDYFYGEEGNTLMSYGPKAWIKYEGETMVTMDYQGKQVPVLSEAAKKELKELTNNNYTSYYRYYLGATFPIGYVKQQGMEYQTVVEKAKPGLDKINKAIELGVLKHVTVTKNSDHFYDMVPTTFALTKAEQNSLGTNFETLDSSINNTKDSTNIWSKIVMNGFGGEGYGSARLPQYDAYISTVNGWNIAQYVAIYNAAYLRMNKPSTSN